MYCYSNISQEPDVALIPAQQGLWTKAEMPVFDHNKHKAHIKPKQRQHFMNDWLYTSKISTMTIQQRCKINMIVDREEEDVLECLM